ncbi:MAG: pseudouridine synthase [Gemmataceae bacterium]
MSLRAFTVSAREAGQSLVAWLASKLARPEHEVRHWLRQRKVRVAGQLCSNAGWRVRAGQRVEVEVPFPTEHPGTLCPSSSRRNSRTAEITIRFIDEHLVVVEKPPGLTTMRHAEDVAAFGPRAKKYLPPTLLDLLPGVVQAHTGKPAGRLRAVHRLDKETSGLIVFARSAAAESSLGVQFRAHSIERVYHALVRGVAVSARIESTLVPDRGDGRRGSGPPGSRDGQHAVTHVRLLEALGAFSLVECRLETGRTHQVRIHLGEAGTPLCGERIYDRPLHGKPLPDGSGVSRVALHAATLGLDHPLTGKRLFWTSPLPPDLEETLKRLRRLARPT